MTVTVTGHGYQAPDGTAATGTVVFVADAASPSEPLPVVGWLTNGTFSVQLAPAEWGWTYQVTENVRGLTPVSYSILLPAELAGQTVDLTDLAPTPSSPGIAVPFVRLPDGGHRIYTRGTDPRTDPAAVVQPGDIWLAPLP